MPSKTTRKYINLSVDELSVGNGSFTFPTVDGLLGQALVTDGLGNVSWQTTGGGGTVNLQQAYDNSSTPEILTDATRGALTLRRGSASDIDPVYEVQNGAGTVTFTLNGNGVITDGRWRAEVIEEIYGGTGKSSYVVGNLLYADAPGTLDTIPIGSAGSFLRSDSSIPSWSTTTFPNSAATGDLIVATGLNNYDNLTAVASGSVLLSQGVGTQPVYGLVVDGATIDFTVGATLTAEVALSSLTEDYLAITSSPATGSAGELLSSDGAGGFTWTTGGGGRVGVFGIADSTGVYTYYSNLDSAMTAAVANQTIQLFTDYIETSPTSVQMKDGVNINLNGHTYEYAGADTKDTLSDGGAGVTVTIFNGTLKRTNSSAPTDTQGVCLSISSSRSIITLKGVLVIADDGSNTCYISAGMLSGGSFIQVGVATGSTVGFYASGKSAFIDNVNVHSYTKGNRADSTIISNSYFRSDGKWGIYLLSGEARNITGYSTVSDGILIGTAAVFNSTGISNAQTGINSGTSGELHNCSGYSSASYGILNGGYAYNCSGKSLGNIGIITGSNSETYNCTAQSDVNVAIFSRGRIVKTSAICKWNNSAGHGFSNVENNDEIVDCYAEVANTLAYGVNAPTTSPYVTGFSGIGMNVLLNLLSNAQTNAEDSFGNIKIG